MVRALFKVAGGKQRLAPEILRLMPTDGWGTYYEGMVGGGSVFFALRAAGRLEGKRVVLADANPDIAALYMAVRDDVVAVISELDDLKAAHAKAVEGKRGLAFYERERTRWNDGDRSPAAQLYLRYAGFNGLWRVNQAGALNVPWNKEPTVAPPSPEDLMDAAIALEGVDVLCADVRAFTLGPTTLAYIDPPYDSEDGQGFTAYTPGGFSPADQTALIQHLAKAANAGAHVVYSNAVTTRVREALAIYWPKSAVYMVQNYRVISRDAGVRGRVKELLVVGGPSVV